MHQSSPHWTRLITILRFLIVRWAFPFHSRPFSAVLSMRLGGKCQPMTFSSVKGTSVHLLCSSQLSDHLPSPVWASLPYVRRPSDKRTLCEANTKGALRSSRSGRTNEEGDKTNARLTATTSGMIWVHIYSTVTTPACNNQRLFIMSSLCINVAEIQSNYWVQVHLANAKFEPAQLHHSGGIRQKWISNRQSARARRDALH